MKLQVFICTFLFLFSVGLPARAEITAAKLTEQVMQRYFSLTHLSFKSQIKKTVSRNRSEKKLFEEWTLHSKMGPRGQFHLTGTDERGVDVQFISNGFGMQQWDSQSNEYSIHWFPKSNLEPRTYRDIDAEGVRCGFGVVLFSWLRPNLRMNKIKEEMEGADFEGTVEGIHHLRRSYWLEEREGVGMKVEHLFRIDEKKFFIVAWDILITDINMEEGTEIRAETRRTFSEFDTSAVPEAFFKINEKMGGF